MTDFVIDASVAIKWFVPDAADEANTAEALDLLLRLRDAEISLFQPPHWKAEVAAVLARRVPAIAAASIDDLNLLEGIAIIDTPLIYDRAVELAIALSHHLFDTLYHATALATDALMVTADRRYYDKAAHLGHIVLLERLAA
jgi:predicted nucleic acid-binding protein